jgi:hypothetical protein
MAWPTLGIVVDDQNTAHHGLLAVGFPLLNARDR